MAALSLAEVAERYDLSEATIRRWAHSGRLRGYRVGDKKIRFDADEVREQLGPPKLGLPLTTIPATTGAEQR